jgi:hypothetical protein
MHPPSEGEGQWITVEGGGSGPLWGWVVVDVYKPGHGDGHTPLHAPCISDTPTQWCTWVGVMALEGPSRYPHPPASHCIYPYGCSKDRLGTDTWCV